MGPAAVLQTARGIEIPIPVCAGLDELARVGIPTRKDQRHTLLCNVCPQVVRFAHHVRRMPHILSQPVARPLARSAAYRPWFARMGYAHGLRALVCLVREWAWLRMSPNTQERATTHCISNR